MKRVSSARKTRVFIPAGQAAEEVVALLRKKEGVLFLCGAGISVARPAVAPDWPSLRDGLLAAFLGRLADAGLLQADDVRETLRSMRLLENQNNLRIKPEVAMHWFHRTFRDELFGAFKVLRQGSPNFNHQILAGLAKRRFVRSLVTTNFDLYLEEALDATRAKFVTFAGAARADGTTPLSSLPSRKDHVMNFRLIKGNSLALRDTFLY